MQCLPVEIVDDVEQPESSTASQGSRFETSLHDQSLDTEGDAASRLSPGGLRRGCGRHARDKDSKQAAAFERLKAELAHAYAAPESSYNALTAADVIARNRI